MNFKLYVESDTRRDFLKKLIGGAAAVAKGDVGKVLDQLSSKIIYLDLNKIAQCVFADLRDEIEEYGDWQHEMLADTHYIAVEKGPLTQTGLNNLLDNNPELLKALHKSASEQAAIGIKSICKHIQNGNLNFQSVQELFNPNNLVDAINLTMANNSAKIVNNSDLNNKIIKFTLNGVVKNVNFGNNVVSNIAVADINKIITNMELNDVHFMFDNPARQKLADMFADNVCNVVREIKNLKKNKQSGNKDVCTIALKKADALKLYNALNQLL